MQDIDMFLLLLFQGIVGHDQGLFFNTKTLICFLKIAAYHKVLIWFVLYKVNLIRVNGN